MVLISRNDQQILAARCELPDQVVPATAVALTAGIDVQQHGFWFVVRAWAPDLTNWLVHYGFLPTWKAVEKLLFENVYPVDGEPERTLKIFRACVDTGGTGKYEDMTMTEETYFWIVKHKYLGALELWGTKGSSTAMPGMLSLGNEIIATHSGKKLPNGLRILMLNSAKLKDQYHSRLALAADVETRDLPAAGFLHKDTGNDYVQQIIAEEKRQDDKTGHESWVNTHGRANHLFDAEVLAGACSDAMFPGGGLMLMAGYIQKQQQAVPHQEPVKKIQEVKKSRW